MTKHLKTVSVARADAFNDFLDDWWRTRDFWYSWRVFRLEKKTWML